MKAYLILGMKRSGHHALVEWISHNLLPQGTSIINDCKIEHDILIPSYKQEIEDQVKAIGDTHNIQNSIFNVEDFDMDYLKNNSLVDLKSLKPYEEVHIILVIRDPWNWLSSCIKRGESVLRGLVGNIYLYNKQCKFYLDSMSNILPNSISVVLFNNWFRNSV
jgi:hypothetical protein